MRKHLFQRFSSDRLDVAASGWGWRAHCSCGWVSMLTLTQGAAKRYQQDHARRENAHPGTRQQRSTPIADDVQQLPPTP